MEHIVEDQEGYLWFATCAGGVSRFDGDEFRTFTTRDGLCSDLVYSMLCDRQGRLWFGTFDRGVCWYDGKEFHRFAEDEWISQRHIGYIFEDDGGRIWVSGTRALGYYDGAVWRDLTPEYRRTCGNEPYNCWGIAQDGNGHLWFGGRILVRYDGSRFYRYGKEDGLLDEETREGLIVLLWMAKAICGWREGHTVLLWMGKAICGWEAKTGSGGTTVTPFSRRRWNSWEGCARSSRTGKKGCGSASLEAEFCATMERLSITIPPGKAWRSIQ